MARNGAEPTPDAIWSHGFRIQFDVSRQKQEFRTLGVFLPEENAKLDEIEMSALKARLKDWETADTELGKYASEKGSKKVKPKAPSAAKPTSNVK